MNIYLSNSGIDLDIGRLLETLLEKHLPVLDTTRQDACMDKIKVVRGKGPWLLKIIDFKLQGPRIIHQQTESSASIQVSSP